MYSRHVHSLAELELAAADLLLKSGHKKVFAFFGEMGSGKTTLIKIICKLMGVSDHVSSPTFALVNQYDDPSGNPVYHFDFYRIEKEQEARDIGISEYFNSGYFCFVEWPEKILHLLPEDTMNIHITVNNETRIITSDNGGT